MTPDQLIEDLNKITDRYAKVSERYFQLRKLYNLWWEGCRIDYKSDASAERAWERTIEGQEMEEARIKLKVYDKKISTIKTNLRHLENEAHNQY